MVDPEESDPRKIIVAFLNALPLTIRPQVLFFVITYAVGIKPPMDKKKLDNIVLNYLSSNGPKAIGAVVCAAAVIDHTLESQNRNNNAAEASAVLLQKYPDNPNFQQVALSVPLQRLHLEQALADWHVLRASKLTPQRLCEFEGSQLNPCMG